MAIGVGAAMLGSSVLGGVMGKRSASKARRANAAQQAAALAFQKQMRQAALKQIDLSQVGAMDRIAAQGESRMGDTLSRLAGAGFNPGTGVGLSALRASKMDTRNAIANMASQMAQQRAGVYTGQSFPMIQHEAQTGQGQGIANLGMMMAMMGGGGGGAGPTGGAFGGAAPFASTVGPAPYSSAGAAQAAYGSALTGPTWGY